MEELSAVGEQVFDAECILNKRLRKVRAAERRPSSFGPSPAGPRRPTVRGAAALTLSLSPGFVSCLAGKVGVSGEVEGMVVQVSTRGAARPDRENNNNVSLVALR